MVPRGRRQSSGWDPELRMASMDHGIGGFCKLGSDSKRRAGNQERTLEALPIDLLS